MKILFITGGSPWPTNIGANQRTYFLHKALSECGAVDLIINSAYVFFTPEEKETMSRKYGLVYLLNPMILGKNNSRSALHFYKLYQKRKEDWFGAYVTNKRSKELVEKIISSNKYNVVVSRYLRSAVNTGAVGFRPIVLDVDDLETNILRSYFRKKEDNKIRSALWPAYCKVIRYLERYYLKKFDYLWFSKESDRRNAGYRPSCVLPNLPFLQRTPNLNGSALRQDRNVALFVGSMKHTLNVEGIDRFINIVWPKIRRSKPDAVLRVAGTGMTDRQESDWNRCEGVQAVGFVEDLESEYANCSFSVIPIKYGGGTKIKLIESLSYGRTCVTYGHSFSGYENVLRDGEDLLVAENDEEFVRKCQELFNDSEKQKRMATSGKMKVDTHFTYSIFQRIVQNTITEVAKKKAHVKAR